MGKTTVEFAGRQIEGETLTDEERSLLLSTVYNYLAGGNQFLLDTFRINEQSIIGAAMVAKDKFDAPIKGVLAGDSEVAVQLLRPGHILRTTSTTETPTNDWTVTLTADDDYWIGFGTTNTSAINVSQYLTLLLLGISFSQGSNPVLEELLVQVGNTTYPVIVVRQSWAADNPNRVRAVRFHPILAEPRQTVLAQTYSIAAGSQELVLLGLALGPGRYLRKQTYAAADLP